MVIDEHFFLFVVAGIWTIFATVQDLKTREVSNWLNFSLIAIAFSYRAFYSVINGNLSFFLMGLFGFGIFFVLAYVFYYGRIFAGGDAKLLMGYGIILPYESYSMTLFWCLGFLFVLFLTGAVYSLFYSTIIVFRNKRTFIDSFKINFSKTIYFSTILLIFSLVFLFLSMFNYSLLFFFLLFLFFLYIYTKSLDSCMIKRVSPFELQEGDWLERDVRVGSKIIKKSVHGLSSEEIKLLRKAKKKVLIKEGVPFVPAFLISFFIMVFFYSVLEFRLERIFHLIFLP